MKSVDRGNLKSLFSPRSQFYNKCHLFSKFIFCKLICECIDVYVEARSEVALFKRNKYDSYLYVIEVCHEHIRVYKAEILHVCVGEHLM
jgi:hypothetical protein